MVALGKHRFRRYLGALAILLSLVFLAGAFHDYLHTHESLDNPCLLQQALAQPCLPSLPVVPALLLLTIICVLEWNRPDPELLWIARFDARGPPVA